MRLSSFLISLTVVLTCHAASPYLLQADGVTDTYTLIERAGYFTETTGNQTPDEFMMHSGTRHITQPWDATIGRYVFAFDIHIDYNEGGKLVTDGNKSELVDRQRNEIKCMDTYPGTVAKDGETITYRWKFMLPAGMKTTGEFCHVHQIKGLGNGDNVAHPVFTLTCRTAGSRQVLQVINVPYEGASNVNLAQLDLSTLLGRWIEATETVTVGKNGAYKLMLKDLTGNVLLNINKPNIQVWRDTDDRSTMRAKWGIYRSLGTDLTLKSQLRSERVLFSDIESVKGDASVSDITADADDSDAPLYDLSGRRVENPVPGLYIQGTKKIIIK